MTSAALIGAFVDELARSGVRHVCVCPGSRSTPLALTLAQHPEIRLWMHLDERSAAYFGVGLARALRQPVALLATSGTAAANFFPAVVEASLGRVPLVVLTADRPPELRDCGAPQTIDQVRLYGEHARWFFELPVPEVGLAVEHVRLVRTIAGRAVGTALAEPAGPVHLNWPLRDPLVPMAQLEPGPDEQSVPAWGARQQGRPYVAVHTGRLVPSDALVDSLSTDLAAASRGVIVCGGQDDLRLPTAVTRLARRLGYPVLADPLSGLRFGADDRSLVVDTYDAFLRDATTVEQLEPEVIVRLGGMPTSKPLLLYLQRYAGARQIVVDPGGWRDPTGLASDVLHVDPGSLCDAVSTRLPSALHGQPDWAARWLDTNSTARQAISEHLASVHELFEGKVFASLPSVSPERAILYVGNSMPVRDLDTFLPASTQPLRCLSNRGANGIDGVVSSALGASAAGLGPVMLVIGDISFYHDLNGLLAARKYDLNLLVVLINNDGGGIFSFLPQAEASAADFELLFGTPHGLDFRPFVEGYGGRFTRVEDWPGFARAVAEGLAQPGLQVVEVPTQRGRNVVLHRDVWQVVARALAGVPVAVG
ncbi:MAG: 2-succinyl-5-enolpyruvyl-6-hydroxy-3-cyclohexene-1-carboxylic-acid synthase [Chloroflexota bacterium]|nr:2-succinyl-5-enolpyruvyl-6-hydroxy-3-cyclohexene-1-carboxylic-acid synthase [Chloroflexota bacterium]